MIDPPDDTDESKPAPRVDDDGIPIDRAPTLDDVRGNDGSHRRLAFGCTAAVAIVLLGFWLVRAVWM